MDTGEIGPIISEPEGWAGMVEKYKQREDEAIAQLLAKRKAATAAELQDIAKKSIVTRALRGATGTAEVPEESSPAPISSAEVIVEPQHEAVKGKLAEIRAESDKANALFKQHFNHPPQGNSGATPAA